MGLNVNWTNPYADREGQWLKGNLHAHSSPASSCATLPVPVVLDLYAGLGYDFLCLSDHMSLTLVEDERLIMVPGMEWNAPGGREHTGIYSADRSAFEWIPSEREQGALLARLRRAGVPVVVTLNHPDWQLKPHYRREDLLARDGYDGVEIYNGNIELCEGDALSTNKWDYLLANGMRVLGFACDDAHSRADIGLGWLVVRSKGHTPQAIVDGLSTGNFYCSTGVSVSDLRRDGGLISVQSPDAQEIQAIGRGGVRVALTRGGSMEIRATDFDTSYVRFTLFGAGSARAWTQPFFVD